LTACGLATLCSSPPAAGNRSPNQPLRSGVQTDTSTNAMEAMLGKVGSMLGMDEELGRREVAAASFLSELTAIAWCPVLLLAPCAGLPWPRVSQLGE
jgi:hypothetical protein